MAGYDNTLTLRIGDWNMFGPPQGSMAAAWDALRAEYPEVDGARIADGGNCLHVQVERTMGTVAERLAIVGRLAAALGAPGRSDPMTWDGGHGTVTWALLNYHGEQICVETSDCTCHPDSP